MATERSVGTPLTAVLESEEEARSFSEWVNLSATKRYIAMVHDAFTGETVVDSEPLCAQQALARIKKQEGALSALRLLLNLDNPQLDQANEGGEVAATWGTKPTTQE